MSPEGFEVVRAFLRRWSTTDITEDTKFLLKEDALRVKSLLEIYGDDASLLDEAMYAPDREWFACKFLELKEIK